MAASRLVKMTGSEIVPAELAKAALKAAGGDPKAKEVLAELSRDKPQMLAAAEAYATRQLVKQQLLLKMYEPLGRLVGISKQYFESGFAGDMAEKMADVPDGNIQAPTPIVAVPAMQALGYSLEEEPLKEMYLNLLARASDDRRSDVHPAHVEIIRQLSPDEVELLAVVLGHRSLPIVNLVEAYPDDGKRTRRRYLLNLYRAAEVWVAPELEAWVDNWIRLGLVTADFTRRLQGGDGEWDWYDWINGRPETASAEAALKRGSVLERKPGMLQRTAFGERFAKAALPESISTGITLPPAE